MQLALQTESMTLDEVVADHAAPFDEVVWALEREALEESERDQDARRDPEFGAIAHLGHLERLEAGEQ